MFVSLHRRWIKFAVGLIAASAFASSDSLVGRLLTLAEIAMLYLTWSRG